ncbi:MAG: peptidoglycan DD-metalloendopeptidase family protein [Candidatus Eremiobacteraeota bacterium]|nr:peptidoglycan DD-metalloendopeptidase family protein [Candidatus Eremiobacteraeota bacterium]
MDFRGAVPADVMPASNAVWRVYICRGFIVAALCGVSCSASASQPSINDRIQEQQSKARGVHEQLHQKRLALQTAQVRVSNLQNQLAATTHAIDDVGAHLDALSAQVRVNQRRLSWNTVQLDAAKATLERHTDALKRRLVDIYERGDLGYLNVILSSTSFSDFVERWDDIRLLVAANQRAIRARREAERVVAGIQQRLESAQVALERSKAQQEQAKTQLAALADERRQLVGLADAQRQHVATQVAQLEGLSAQEERSLEGLIVERQREYEAQRRAAAAAAAAARRAAGVAVLPPETGAPGALGWPVSGPVTSPFGYRQSPFGGGTEFHMGLDIAANMGTTIAASAAGRVISASWYGGYGNYILIDHGGGISTGYAHCSAIFVSPGQDVQKGQAIGAVGSTGASTGPHLHFEVRVDGRPVDPASRLH